jgi:hypothetical protein
MSIEHHSSIFGIEDRFLDSAAKMMKLEEVCHANSNKANKGVGV